MSVRTVSGTPDLSSQDPNWWRQAVIYQIYPRSFADADGDGLGDLRGVTQRLTHLAALGVDALWLSPFYPSELADGGYDVDDYRDVDPRLGTLDDFDALAAEAHRLGLKVIVDLVPNHTSHRHAWFREALAAGPGSAARDRYVFRDGRGERGELPPTDWQSVFGGSAWQRVPDGQWYLHLFTPEQPDLNWENEQVRADFRTTLKFWSDRGVDGFRVDVAHALAKDLAEPLRDLGAPELSDEASLAHLPPGSHPFFDRDDVHEIYRDWRKILDAYRPPRMAVAEAWVPGARRALYARPDELGQAFNFEYLKAGWDAAELRQVIEDSLADAAAAGASATWVLANHDVVRPASRLMLPPGTDTDAWLLAGGAAPAVDEAAGLRRARAANLLMLALPGSAYLYQGEELGLPEVADLPTEVLQDPIWEQTGHVRKGRDGCRVPLPWTTDGPSYGFGAAGAWLPQPPSFAAYSVQAQDGVEGSTLELYRAALKLRRKLLDGETLTWSEEAPPGVLRFDRSPGWRCVANLSGRPVDLPAGEVLLTSAPLEDGRLGPDTTAWLGL
ncbi:MULTISPECIES: glycoside hydrolase family 13 protein [Streptomyces]|uniref:Alpha-glucosidase n=2 Tax=Streptomyces TaxID=1883 RepID=A0ABT9LH79_STRGD|nr:MULTISPECIES: alpha-amylase family glycosyl hydrolase [Streptomyces]MDP9683038.1 alpha-glucosidase [Streptomyces griseoviridis]GGS89802.1 glycosidase [Streptomyces griseoviridis]GGU61117.1 glycosidase [Streptomyces daghestanicus]GHI32672.1 glycosidase [Streptomyces daghestanicus]